MSLPKEIKRLVERFRENRDVYCSSAYNETQARHEFIDPFFMALGWDVNNEKGYAEAYKEVIHEDAIKVGGATKAPDYAFRLGGVRKFFVEAKRPGLNIKEDGDAAYQLRRYAWSAKLPLSILTDFEEFAVYDCRIKPARTDKASAGRVLYLTANEYVDQWDEIEAIFSQEAIWKGSFDKYIESTKRKKGTAEVDTAFLKEIEAWRDVLARNIALRNTKLSTRELNFAVQRTIDRIIFLRICEDRGIEDYGQLMALQNGTSTYERLSQIFRRADERYNSGLFHFRKEKERPEPPDGLTLNLTVDDKVLKGIVKELYYPESPYEFSVLPADILGQVYEQFLGKVIRLTPAHRAVVEGKPEVKKAGGVYYTPTYIVDYIVEHTVGKLLEKKTHQQASKLRILDPACGSGSFLLGAYQTLLDWHLRWYSEHDPEKHAKGRKPKIFRGPGGDWRLTTAERKRILLNSIYGVDIDPQAVEVTKLSLLLKVLEGENEETLGKSLRLFHERALPDLADNIKCGNSLIGPDFYEGKQLSLIDEEERYRINAFDWNAEFPEIMAAGGFDAVIGNPPYLRIQGLQEYYGVSVPYFVKQYRSAVKRFDLYLLFVERGFELLSKGGRLGFICPHKFLNSDFGSGLREYLNENSALDTFISFGNNLVFPQVATYTGILSLLEGGSSQFRYCELHEVSKTDLPGMLRSLTNKDFASYDASTFSDEPWVLTNRSTQALLRKLTKQSWTLGEVVDEILVGVQSGIDSIHVLRSAGKPSTSTVTAFSERAESEIEVEPELLKPFLRGKDVHRYVELRPSYYCIYPYNLVNNKTVIIEESELRSRFPLGYAYLREYRSELRDIRRRQKTNPFYWYSCHRSRDMRAFEADRIVTPEISLGCNMTLAPAGMYHNTKVYSILPSQAYKEDTKYWLGLLNSRIAWWFISSTGYVLRGGYFAFKTDYLKPFPVRGIDFSNSTDKTRHDRMVELVDSMLKLHRDLQATKTDHEKSLIQRQIDATDKQIDQLVYELYGLTAKEIRIVEEATK